MKVVNEFMLFEAGESITLPEDFPPIPDDKTAIFGFKINETGDSKEWVHATEAELRISQKRLGVSEEEINATIERQLAGRGCYVQNNSCYGSDCPGNLFCSASYDGQGRLIFCGCRSF